MEKEKEKKKKRLLILIIALLLVAGAATTAGVLINKNRQGGGESEISQQAESKPVEESKPEEESKEPEIDYTGMKEILEAAYALGENEAMEGTYTLTGKITQINTPYSDQYGNITVTIVVDDMTDMPIQCYRMTGPDADVLQALKKNDIITVFGAIKNYNGKVEFDAGCLLRDVIPGEEEEPVEGPTDAGEIIKEAYALKNGAMMDSEVSLRGVITAINTPYSADYGNISVTIQVEGYEKYPIMCYRMKGEGVADLKVTDTITCTGTIQNYNGTIEFGAGCICSDIVPGKGTPTLKTTAQILAAAKKLKDGESLDKEYSLTGKVITPPSQYVYTNTNTGEKTDEANFTIDVNGTEIYCYATKGAKIKQVQLGDTVTVTGYIKNYQGKIEFDKGQLTALKKGEAAGEATLKTPEEIVNGLYDLGANEYLEGGKSYTLTGVVTAIVGNIKTDMDSYGNATFDIVVGTMTDKPVRAYRAKPGSGVTNAAVKGLKVGDTVTVTGYLTNYVGSNGGTGTREFTQGCTIDKITKQAVGTYTVTALSADETMGTVSVDGYTITVTPNEGYKYAGYEVTEGTATVTVEDNTLTVSPLTNCTVTVSFKEIPTVKPTAILTDGLRDGQKVIIVVAGAAPTTETYTKGYTTATPEINGDTLTVEDNYLILTVKATGTDGQYYLLDDAGKYLACEQSGNKLYVVDAADDYSLWEVLDKDGTTVIGNVNALYTNASTGATKKQAIEIYNGSYTIYGYADNNSNWAAYSAQIFALNETGTPYAVGKAYKYVVNQKNFNPAKTLYATGAMSGNFLATSENVADAADIYLEQVEGGFRLYFLNGETKNYLDLYEYQTGKVGMQLTTEPNAVYTYNEDMDIFTANVLDNDYYFGCYGTYTTISKSTTSYITGDNASALDATQHPARLTEVTAEPPVEETYTVTAVSADETKGTVSVDGYVITVTPAAGYKYAGYEVTAGTATVTVEGNTLTVAPTSDCTITVAFEEEGAPAEFPYETGKAYKFVVNQKNIEGQPTLYFTGAMSGNYLASSRNAEDGADIYLEEVEGGYRLYFMDGETKTYIDLYEYQTGKCGVQLTAEPTAVYTYNEDIDIFTANVAGADYYLGCYRTFETYSASNISYITGGNASQLDASQHPARLKTVGEEPPVVVTYTVTAVSADTTKGTVSVDGYVITVTPATGYKYSGYEVTAGTATVTVEGNTLTVEPTSDCTVTVSFEAEATPVEFPYETGKAYKFVVNQKNIEGQPTLYFTGAMSGNYLASSRNAEDGADIYLEEVEGGYRLYFMDGETKTYIDLYEYQTGKCGVRLTAEPTAVYTYNEAMDIFTANVADADYYLGCYRTFETYSASNTSYITGGNASQLDASQHPARLKTVGEEPPVVVTYTVTAVSADTTKGTVSVDGYVITVTPATGYKYSGYEVTAGTATVTVEGNTLTVEPTSDCTVTVSFEAEATPVEFPYETGKAYKFGLTQMNILNHPTLYFNGQLSGNFFATTENAAEAVDVYLEEVEGGYRLYFMDGTTKTYLDLYEYQTGKCGMRLTTENPYAVFTYLESADTFKADVLGTEYYFGTYNNYTTISKSPISYITGDNAIKVDQDQFPARLLTVSEEPPVAETYTITAGVRGNQNGTVTVDGYVITMYPNPGFKYDSYDLYEGTATVTVSGNTLTLVPTSDCKIEVIFVIDDTTQKVASAIDFSMLKDGDRIYITNSGKVPTVTTYSNGFTLAEAAFSGFEMIVKDNYLMLIYKPTSTEGQFYLQDASGKYLTCEATGGSLTLQTTANEYSLWTFADKVGSTVIESVNALYTNSTTGATKKQGLKFYNTYFTVYGYAEDNTNWGAYEFTLYVLPDEEPEPTYTVTAVSADTTKGTVSVDGYVITVTPATGYKYAGYEVTSGTATVTVVGNTLTVAPTSDCTVTVSFEADNTDPSFPYTVGAAYNFVVNQKNIAADKMLYFTGAMSGNYLASSDNAADAVQVFIEEVTGGYRLYFLDGTVKTYIDLYEYQSGKCGLQLTTVPTAVYTYSEDMDLFTANVADGDYYIGCYRTYETFSASSTSYITGENASALDDSQHPARLKAAAIIPTVAVTFEYIEGAQTLNYPQDKMVTLPTDEEDRGDYIFVGWVTEKISAETTTEPTILTKARFTTATTLYPVFKRTTAGSGDVSYTLATSASDLASGKKAIIAAAGYDIALGGYASQFYSAIAVTKSDATLTPSNGVVIWTLGNGAVSGTWSFYDEENEWYLAAITTKNKVANQPSVDAAASFTVTFNGNEVKLVSNHPTSSYTNLLYNANSGQERFACYTSAQKPLALYVQTGGAVSSYTSVPR